MNSLQEYTSFTLETISIDLLPKEALEKFEGYSKKVYSTRRVCFRKF